MNKFIAFRLTEEADYYKAIIIAPDLEGAARQFRLILEEENENGQAYQLTPWVDYYFDNGKVKLPPGTETRIMWISHLNRELNDENF